MEKIISALAEFDKDEYLSLIRITFDKSELLKLSKALEKQTSTTRIIKQGKYYCPKCNKKMDEAGFCLNCGQKLY